MEWPSKNVPRGGFMHAAKSSYSPDTHKFLKLLMEESKLSMMQRKKFNYCLRNGEPLPPISHTSRSRVNIPEVTIRPGSSKRRTRETIVQSGAYEREEFRPHHPVVDREKEKERLQNKMAYNEEIKVRKPKIFQKLVSKEDKEEINRFDQIVQEIKEREEWLKEMEALGQGNKYRQIIELQIQEKVREMNKMKFENIKQ
ncbi:UPF0193 protein EVG1 homolog [Leptinotarsa decemlineata]|uniref:UPF0193 protein EVG1 homolog n=1 Tax=Leptinotarsa decemlineata TaxID=7539 RepID=UPI003D3069A4